MTATIQSRLFQTSIDLAEPTRLQMVDLLSSCLADISDLQTHARHAHWNVKGPQFLSLHDLFEQIASRLQRQANDVAAERITALGGVAQATARQVVGGDERSGVRPGSGCRRGSYPGAGEAHGAGGRTH